MRFLPTPGIQLPRRALRSVAAVAIVLFVAGCGDATGPVADGIGNVTASGAVSLSGSGLARQQAFGTSMFQVLIMPRAAGPAYGWRLHIIGFAGRPAVGTHDFLGGTEGLTATLYYTSNGSTRMFKSVSGEFTVSSYSESVMKGTFRFMAEELPESTTVQVEGSFAATCPPPFSCI
jgi:hypothetical protein